MPRDLPRKVAHLIRDFRAIHTLIDYIDHEFEKKTVARLGLVKIEALSAILGTYKNQIKRSLGTAQATIISDLELVLARLRKDVDDGVRKARNTQVGHSLKLGFVNIPEQWLFMGHSTFTILNDDLTEIQILITRLDSSYVAAPQLAKIPKKYKDFWRDQKQLGPPQTIRCATVYAGMWTHDIVSPLASGTAFQDATIRVFGLRLFLRQIGILIRPFLEEKTICIWERLLIELAMIDFFSLEEAVFDGNTRGQTPSLIDEWQSTSQPHNGVNSLLNNRNNLNPVRSQWRNEIRNKVCAHMDLDVPAAMLDFTSWPLNLPDFNNEIEALCQMLGDAARLDIRTKFLSGPAISMKNISGLATSLAPKWNDT
jgi:hypothetical protein